jgi:glutamine amidotransferase
MDGSLPAGEGGGGRLIGIVNYGLGNLRSIQNMLRRAGIDAVISNDPDVLRKCDRFILPGVGHFRYGMERLRECGLIEFLDERVLKARLPVLGICLGAQLFGRCSEEGDVRGLGWIAMDTIAFDRRQLTQGERIPHMSWTDTICKTHPLFNGISEPRFYYVHSFHFACDDNDDVICEAVYGYRFASGFARNNVMGVQFHPEKSHTFGRQLLKNWAEIPF